MSIARKHTRPLNTLSAASLSVLATGVLLAIGVGSCAELDAQDAAHARKPADSAPASDSSASNELPAHADGSASPATDEPTIDIVPSDTPRWNQRVQSTSAATPADAATSPSAPPSLFTSMTLEVSTLVVPPSCVLSTDPTEASWMPDATPLDVFAWSVTGSPAITTQNISQPNTAAPPTDLHSIEQPIVSLASDAPGYIDDATLAATITAATPIPSTSASTVQTPTPASPNVTATTPIIHAPTPVRAEPPVQPIKPVIADVAPPLTLPSCITQRPMPATTARAVAPALPPPPTAAVAFSARAATSAPPGSPIIPYSLLAAMFLAAIATCGLALITAGTTDSSGTPRRALTISCRITLAFGTLAVALIGCCRFGAAISTSIGGQITCIVLAVVGTMLCIGAGLWLCRTITVPMAAALTNIRALAAGNLLIAPLNSTMRDELGELARATDKLAASVKDIISEVAISSSDVAAAASELAIGAQGMSAAAGHVSTQCSVVAGDASSAGRLATSGGRSLQQAAAEIARVDDFVSTNASTVRGLADRGRQVARVVELIDDISDRTHLVALNASIEASKAGPNGRAFALLADEVRRLAERAQKATEEAAATVRGVQDECSAATERMSFGAAQIKQSADLTGRAGHDIAEIIRTAGGVSTMIQTIGAAAEEAGAGAAQSAGAAAQLSTRAEDLKAMVSRFRIDTSSFMRHSARTN